MDTEGPNWDEETQKHKLFKATKYFFLFAMIFSLWLVIVISGVYFLQLGGKWAVLTIEQWILSAIVLISLVIALDIIFLIRFILLREKYLHPEKRRKKEFIQGKRVYRYTIPLDAKGGIFSKTYILIDENRVLKLRYQMIPPGDLWGEKQ
jgi:hypothetical protein